MYILTVFCVVEPGVNKPPSQQTPEENAESDRIWTQCAELFSELDNDYSQNPAKKKMLAQRELEHPSTEAAKKKVRREKAEVRNHERAMKRFAAEEKVVRGHIFCRACKQMESTHTFVCGHPLCEACSAGVVRCPVVGCHQPVSDRYVLHWSSWFVLKRCFCIVCCCRLFSPFGFSSLFSNDSSSSRIESSRKKQTELDFRKKTKHWYIRNGVTPFDKAWGMHTYSFFWMPMIVINCGSNRGTEPKNCVCRVVRIGQILTSTCTLVSLRNVWLKWLYEFFLRIFFMSSPIGHVLVISSEKCISVSEPPSFEKIAAKCPTDVDMQQHVEHGTAIINPCKYIHCSNSQEVTVRLNFGQWTQLFRNSIFQFGHAFQHTIRSL